MAQQKSHEWWMEQLREKKDIVCLTHEAHVYIVSLAIQMLFADMPVRAKIVKAFGPKHKQQKLSKDGRPKEIAQ